MESSELLSELSLIAMQGPYMLRVSLGNFSWISYADEE